MKRIWWTLPILTLSLFGIAVAQAGDHGQEKVCFCHNINHNPVTICTANPALVNAHMKHVDGEIPGVLDDLDECVEEVPEVDCDEFTIDGYDLEDWELVDGAEEIPFEEICISDEDGEDIPGTPDDGEIPGDDEEIDEDVPGDSEDGFEEEVIEDEENGEIAQPEGDQIALDSPEAGDFDDPTGYSNYGLLEGSGCSLNSQAASQSGAFWIFLGTLPLLGTVRRFGMKNH